MIRVVLKKFGEPDPVPTWLDGSIRAVRSEPFADVDTGQGGITRADIVGEGMLAPLDTFPPGAEVYIESEEAADCLFDDDLEAEESSHIWWRAIIVTG